MKTVKNEQNVEAFLQSVENETRRMDGFEVLQMMQEVTGKEPKMWGDTIVGFGQYHFKYESGREGDMPLIAFSPRKQSMTVYIMPGFDNYDTLLGKLGKHKTGKDCLYINKLADVDKDVLRTLIKESYDHMASTNP
jgi:hypothetical protein